MHDWWNGTSEGDWVSMAIPSDGSYGVAEGIISSFPCTCADGRYEVVQGLEIDEFSRQRIDATVGELSRSVDHRGVVRQQERHDACHFLGTGHPALKAPDHRVRTAGAECLVEHRHRVLLHRRVDEGGQQRIGTDVGRT